MLRRTELRFARPGSWKLGLVRLLFNAASKTLLEFGRNPRWVGGELGITMALHTWGQNLGQHIHVHCIVTDDALSPDRERWLTPVRRGFVFPTSAVSKVFRGKYLDFLTAAHRNGELRMPGARCLRGRTRTLAAESSRRANRGVDEGRVRRGLP